jgi:succinate-acetate transporter protein
MTRTMTNGHDRTADPAEFTFWRDHTQISLSPVAAPSVLGLFGYAASTFMVAANLVGWYGNTATTPLILFPFFMVFGGVAQFLAGMWSYRARDTLATAVHGTWGSFWFGYGIYQLLISLGVLPGATANPIAGTAFGYWFIVLAALTWMFFFASLAENIAMATVLVALAAGSTLLAIAFTAGMMGAVLTVGSYLLLVSALLAFYTGSAMVLESTYKRVVLPLGKRGEPDVPGTAGKHVIGYEMGEPGIKVGQ